MKRAAIFLLLFCAGCAAQSSAPTDVNRRVERLIRSHFNVAGSVEIKVGDRKPSDFTGYDMVPVTLSRGEHSNTYNFLLSKDGKRLVQLVPIEDPMEKIDLSGRPIRGAKDAKVTIVNFDDFQCPFCARNHQALMEDVLKQYGDRVRIIYKDFPLSEIHPWANHAAIDSNCLAAQNGDAYWEFADYVHAHQKDISGTNRPLKDQFSALDSLASDIGARRGLDSLRLQGCLKAQPDAAVKASIAEANSLNIAATPTMFINGEKLDGAAPVEDIRAAIDRALKDAGQTPPATAAQANPPSSGQQH
jgi:protein-disulfide isomerase